MYLKIIQVSSQFIIEKKNTDTEIRKYRKIYQNERKNRKYRKYRKYRTMEDELLQSEIIGLYRKSSENRGYRSL